MIDKEVRMQLSIDTRSPYLQHEWLMNKLGISFDCIVLKTVMNRFKATILKFCVI